MGHLDAARAQTAAQTQKAIAAGVPGRRRRQRHRRRAPPPRKRWNARAGDGPSLIEAITYRLGDHTTADDASRYRDEASVKAHWAQEPVLRLRNYLASLGAWDAAREEALIKDCAQQVAQAVEAYATPMPAPAAMFEHLYATLPAALAGQLAMAQRFAGADTPP